MNTEQEITYDDVLDPANPIVDALTAAGFECRSETIYTARFDGVYEGIVVNKGTRPRLSICQIGQTLMAAQARHLGITRIDRDLVVRVPDKSWRMS